jgi:hypothetical protein
MAVKATQTITVYKSVDVASLTLYFKTVNAGSSAPAKPTTATPSGWSTSEPTLDVSKDLYATLKTTYTDNNFYYSDPQKYSSYEAAKTAYNTAVAANTNANTALSRSVEKSDTAPADTNKLWLDLTSGMLKQYIVDGQGDGSWQVINDYSTAVGDLGQQLQNLNSDLADASNDLRELINSTKTTLDTNLEQTSTAFEMQFSAITERITGYVDDLQQHITKQNQYIRFELGTITLGDSESPYSLKIENDKIQIYYNNSNIISSWDRTTFKATSMHTNELTIKDSSWAYNFKFIPRANGSLSFRKVSE